MTNHGVIMWSIFYWRVSRLYHATIYATQNYYPRHKLIHTTLRARLYVKVLLCRNWEWKAWRKVKNCTEVKRTLISRRCRHSLFRSSAKNILRHISVRALQSWLWFGFRRMWSKCVLHSIRYGSCGLANGFWNRSRLRRHIWLVCCGWTRSAFVPCCYKSTLHRLNTLWDRVAEWLQQCGLLGFGTALAIHLICCLLPFCFDRVDSLAHLINCSVVTVRSMLSSIVHVFL